MHLFIVFVANNSKITNPNSLFCTEPQHPNNELITIKTLSKPAWSHLEGRAKGERTISVTLLNIKHFNPNPSLCIIRNENSKKMIFCYF